MFVSSNLGTQECNIFSEYEKHIQEAVFHHPGNEIWCSLHGVPEDYPCLSILVKGNDAVVNYFAVDNTEMFASVGDMQRRGVIDFENGQYEIAAYQAIPPVSAMNAALEFFHNQARPSCIEWDEL